MQQGLELMRKCVGEIGKRLVVNLPRFKVRIVDKDGIRSLEDINTKDLKIFD
jgi:20S proteasome subunit beta 4